MNKPKERKSYLLIYEPEESKDDYPIHLMFKKMARCINPPKGKQIIVGHKVKMHLIEDQKHWDQYPFERKMWYYQLSNHLSHLIFNYKHVLGKCIYYYKYTIQYAMENKIRYYYISYNPIKPLKSVQEYYSQFTQQQIMQQQNDASPSYVKLPCIECVSTANNIHKLYIGLTLTDNVIDIHWKKIIFSAIHNWATNGVPKGIHSVETANRWKFFLYYWYVYREKGISTSKLNAESKINAGLRKIPDPFIPDWINKLIKHLKNINFIDPELEINQIGINYYFNKKQKDMVYSYIGPHKEHDKFSVVYSVSIYSDSDGQTFLSFNLKNNKYNGDLKVPLKDCGGCTMQSNLCIYVYMYIYIYMCMDKII